MPGLAFFLLTLACPHAPLRAATLREEIVVAASSVAKLDADPATCAGTDATSALQRVINSASPTTHVTLVLDGLASVKGLRQRGNVDIVTNNGGGLCLRAGSNKAAISNANPTAGDVMDQNLTLKNITIYANGPLQSNVEQDDSFVVGIKFFGVSNVTMENVHVVGARRFGIHFFNAHHVRMTGAWISQPDYSMNNHDGIHINGLCDDFQIHDTRLTKTTDDGIALNADDDPVIGYLITNGPITNITIDGLTLDNAYFGVRLLSDTNRIDGVSVSNVAGVIQEYVLAARSSGDILRGVGNIGTVSLDGVGVTTFSQSPQGIFNAAVLVDAHVEHLSVTNFNQGGGWYPDYRPIIRVTGGSAGPGHVGLLDAALTVHDPPGTDTAGGGSLLAGSRVVVDGSVDLLNLMINYDRDASVARNFGAVWISGTVGELNIGGSVSRLLNAIQLAGGRLDVLRLKGLSDTEDAGLTFYVAPGASAPFLFEDSSLTNPIDSAQTFVRQQYADFLGREPDAAGLSFWTRGITSCGTEQQCVAYRRVDTSAAFFLSIEFQQTGFLVYKMYKTSFGDLSSARPVAVRRANWIPDTHTIGGGVVVGQTGWEQKLEANKQAFALDFVQRPAFQQAHASQDAATFVNSLFANAGVSPTDAERQTAVAAFGGGGSAGQAAALRCVAESGSVSAKLFDEAFVLMQYFGYLRRDPDDPPDADYSGYSFWFGKLEQFGGDYQRAEMVKAFINSTEYRQRFGQ